MLQLEKISKSYEGFQALKEISCTLHRGSITVLLGPNGAGKSTLMRILAGLLRPDSGRVQLEHQALAHDMKIPCSIGFLSDNQILDPSLDVKSLLLLVARLKKVTNPAAEVARWIEEFKIGHILNKPIEALSSGHRQRVALAQALLGDSELLLLDEPGLSLDPGQYQQFEKILVREKKNRYVLLSTHRLKDIERVGDHLILLNQGKVLQEGSKNDLLESIQENRQKLELKNPYPILEAFLKQSEIKYETIDHKTYLFENLDAQKQALILAHLAQNEIFIESLTPNQRGLEELFFNMLNTGERN